MDEFGSKPFATQTEDGKFFLAYKGERYSGPYTSGFCSNMVESLNNAWQLGFADGAKVPLADVLRNKA